MTSGFLAGASAQSSVDDRLPRELAPGVFWIGSCVHYGLDSGSMLISESAYLVSGTNASALVDTGTPGNFEQIKRQIDEVVAGGQAPLRYVFGSHWEAPHNGATGLLLRHYPDTRYCGDTSDFDLIYPGFSDRVLDLQIGDSLNLGGRELVIQPGIFCDYRSTRWAFDTKTRTLFTADGIAYGHDHSPQQCGMTAEEIGPQLDVTKKAAAFADIALYWTQFVDVEPYLAQFKQLIKDLDVQLVCPAHGPPVTDPTVTLPFVYEGVREGATRDW